MAEGSGERQLKVNAGCSNWVVRLLTAASAVGLAGVGVTAFLAHRARFRAPITEYGLVIDAGSHGNRIHLYEWPERLHDPNHPLRGPITFPQHIWQFNTVPGISSKVFDPESTGKDCIGPLIEAAKNELRRKNVPEPRWSTFPIYLKATAGMRDVGVTTRGLVMWNIRDFLSDKEKNPFKFRLDWARVTAGEEEGVYGWLTVNKAMGTLQRPAAETWGALDMGGASTQITFFPTHTSVMEDYYALTLGTRLIRLYAHSYLGFGWGDSLMRLSTRLGVELVNKHVRDYKTPTNTTDSAVHLPSLEDRPDSATAGQPVIIEAEHPCFPEGHEFQLVMPSLEYPDGRFYVDINHDHIVEYMEAVGLPEKALAQAKDQAFMKEPGSDKGRRLMAKSPMADENSDESDSDETKSTDDDNNTTEENASGRNSDNEDDEETVKGDIPPRPKVGPKDKQSVKGDKLPRAEESQKDEESVKGDIPPRPEMGQKDEESVKGDIPPRPEMGQKDEESVKGDIPPRPKSALTKSDAEEAMKAAQPPSNADTVSLRSSDGKHHHKHNHDKKHKKPAKGNFADVVMQDTRASLHGGHSKGPFNALKNGDLLQQQKYAYTIKFTGSSNYHQCRSRAADLFLETPCFIHSCSFNSVYQPRLDGAKFLAFGQYSKVQTALGIDPNSALNVFEAAAERYCTLSRDTIRKGHKKGLYRPYGKNGAMKLCWKATWSHVFLTEALKFSGNSTAITFAQTVGEGVNAQAPGWGLGSMIYEVNLFPWDTPIGRYQLPFWVSVATLAALSTLAAVLSCHVDWLRKLYSSSSSSAYHSLT